jgi:hypothetical protein
MMMIIDRYGRQHYHDLCGPWTGCNAIETSTASTHAIWSYQSRTIGVIVDAVHAGAQFDRSIVVYSIRPEI